MYTHYPNRWRGFLLGALGGIAGIAAMRYYWQQVEARTGEDPRTKKVEGKEPSQLDDISLVGQNHEPGESSTAALGRLIYTKAAGRPPQAKETKNSLSYITHWLISMVTSGLYGATRPKAGVFDLSGGLALGAGLWLLGDEALMPMMGLTDGPTAYPKETHLHSLGAHLAFGIASAVTTQLLDWITHDW